MPSSPSPSPDRCHFSGLAGGGMSALAWYLRLSGRAVSGSDRAFDRDDAAVADTRAAMERAGITVTPQDGTGLTADHTALVVSTAIEGDGPEVVRARALGVPVWHRSELLAALSAEKKTIAVAGTSGKSTVTGMIWHMLEAAGLAPSLITGANLTALSRRGLPGNAAFGTGDWLVIEADESDGSLVRYRPEVAVLLNIEKDHQEIDALMPLFRTFRERSRHAVCNRADARCASLARPEDIPFDKDSAGGIPAVGAVFGEWSSSFRWDGAAVEVPVPGRHNAENALAALAVARLLRDEGVTAADAARGLAAFQGVERRYVRVGEAPRDGGPGITVVDDFAHNPAKVRAALETAKGTARGLDRRVLAVFHPHGFAPMKLVGRDIMEHAAEVLGPDDRLYLPDIYYAGGTADQSISSVDLAARLNELKPGVGIHLPTKEAVIAAVAAAARPGDVVLSMGARDPSLGDFAARLLAALSAPGR